MRNYNIHLDSVEDEACFQMEMSDEEALFLERFCEEANAYKGRYGTTITFELAVENDAG